MENKWKLNLAIRLHAAVHTLPALGTFIKLLKVTFWT